MKERKINLMRLRETMGRPPFEEVEWWMTHAPEIRRWGFQTLDNKDAVLGEFQKVKRAGLEHNVTESRPYVCAVVLDRGIAEQSLHQAEECLQKNDIPAFRFYFDVYSGMSNAAAAVRGAEDELRGETDQSILDYLDDTRRALNTDLPVAEEAEIYTAVSGLSLEYTKVLQADPTGFTVIDHHIDRIRVERGGDDSSDPSFAYELLGAELARDLYHELYDIAGELYP